MRLAVAATLLTAMFTCTGCPREPELEPAPDCNAQMPSDTSMLPQRELQLGELVDGTFKPWSDGQQVKLVYGAQGFAMLTPYFQLPAEASDEDSECWHVLYYHLDADGNPSNDEGQFSAGLVFSLTGDAMETGPLFDLADGASSEPVRLRATVSSPNFVAVDEVSIVLVD